MNMKREYLEYANGEYTEVRNFLKEKDGVVDLDKHRMIYDKLTMRYESWVETKMNTGSAGTETGRKHPAGEPGKNEEGKRESLSEIIAKYDLSEDNGLLKLNKYLENGFPDLARKLEAHGYRYNKEKRVFVPQWNGVKK